jgi:hypothetical protein
VLVLVSVLHCIVNDLKVRYGVVVEATVHLKRASKVRFATSSCSVAYCIITIVRFMYALSSALQCT